MTKRFMIRVVSFSLAAVVVASGIAVAGWHRSNVYRGHLENNYQRAFAGLVSSMSGIDYALQKGCVSSSPVMLASLGGEIFRQSASATEALSQLPFADLRLEKTSKFISQVGDWAYTMSRRAAARQSLSDEEREILQKLSIAADALSQDLNILNQEVNENRLEFGEITRAEQRLGEEEEGEAPAGVAQNVAHLEQEFPEYPTLVYDGPFSEHIEQMTPAFLQGKPQVDEAAARAVAARFLGVAENQVKSVGESDGKIPVYSFSCSRKGGEVSIDVTRQGGSVLQMLDSRTPNAPALDLAAATQKAKAFLREQGYPEMKESYWTSYADTVMINFAPVQDGVILYPDLVKVSIALDDGSVCNFEAQGFLMNHKTRSIPQAKITAKTAESKVAKGLTVLNQNLAVVPSSGRYEVFVRELQCESADGKHCLIYLDAQTGEEVQILILLEDANGILAM